MRIFIIIVLIIISVLGFGVEDYEKIFSPNYQKAVLYIESNRTYFSAELQKYGADPSILIPVVFPEILRYSILQDTVEANAVGFFYGNFGVMAVDFSVGYFQMKPSFIENLEFAVNQYKLKDLYFIAYYESHLSKTQIRNRRIERLMDQRWQLVYLSAFYRIVIQKYQEILSKLNPEEKTRFIAAAYNRGFHTGAAVIQASMKARSYPDGERSDKKQYFYGDIVWDYAVRHWKKR